MQWQVPVARWAVWPAGAGYASSAQEADARGGSSPDVGFVDPMLRRRLGKLARMALSVAHDAADDLARVRMVFASQHGDLSRSLRLLRELAVDELLSPTDFSLSVHNAIPGIFSIIRKDTSPITAVAAGAETFGFALLEASAQLEANPSEAVLLAYADEPVPDEYGAFVGPCPPAHAVAVRLESGAARVITCTRRTAPESGSELPQSLGFIRALASGEEYRWSRGGATWVWR